MLVSPLLAILLLVFLMLVFLTLVFPMLVFPTHLLLCPSLSFLLEQSLTAWEVFPSLCLLSLRRLSLLRRLLRLLRRLLRKNLNLCWRLRESKLFNHLNKLFQNIILEVALGPLK